VDQFSAVGQPSQAPTTTLVAMPVGRSMPPAPIAAAAAPLDAIFSREADWSVKHSQAVLSARPH